VGLARLAISRKVTANQRHPSTAGLRIMSRICARSLGFAANLTTIGISTMAVDCQPASTFGEVNWNKAGNTNEVACSIVISGRRGPHKSPDIGAFQSNGSFTARIGNTGPYFKAVAWT
jgi:hypothetical protein